MSKKTRTYNGSMSLARAGLGSGSGYATFTPMPDENGNRAARRQAAKRKKRKP